MIISQIGQGELLSEGLPYRGEWIFKPHVFLDYLDDLGEETAQVPDVTTIAITIEVRSGGKNWLVGFNAATVANAFGIGRAELLAANRTKELKLEAIEVLGFQTSTGRQNRIYTFFKRNL